MGNDKLENGILSIEPGTEIILSETYAEREDIEQLILPPTVREIGGASFAGCENLKVVKFSGENHVKQICDGAFTLCHSLTSYDFREGLEEIGEMAFWETSLVKVDLPMGLKKIGDSAFWSCGKLMELNLPEPDCEIGTDVLGDCINLKEGFIAPGYASSTYYNQADELVYTLLWLSCPEKHNEKTSERAKAFIRDQKPVITEMILERNNIPAMTGLVEQNLLDGYDLEKFVEEANKRGELEITNLLLESKRKKSGAGFEEFEL